MRRAALMRTAATALIAASPFVYSGASATTTSGSVQLTAPTIKAGKIASGPRVFSIASADATIGNFQLSAPIFEGGKLANLSLASTATPGSFKLNAPTLAGFSAARSSGGAHQPVQNLLAVPMEAQAGPATISASAFSITPMVAGTTYVDNSDDLTVTPTETAIDVVGGQNHVIVNNTGDLTGGGGINVSSGDFDPNDPSQLVSSSQYGWNAYYTAQLFDDANNPVTEPCSWNPAYTCNVYVHTADVYNNLITNLVNADQSDVEITINNGGNIDFSGLYGIRASNPAGDLIDITNSGDISSTADTMRRVGIFADTTADVVQTYDGPNEITPGEYTYNSYGNLTGVITVGQHEKTTTTTFPVNDLGAIRIANSGDIDMGAVDASAVPPNYGVPFPYGMSEGIYARGWGGTDIVNQASGSIKVGDFSTGITSISGGDVTIENDGTIEIGNQSVGIKSIAGVQPGETYSAVGDMLIVNTGDIIGGMTRAEAEASANANAFGTFKPASSVGIWVDSLGTNRDYYGRFPEIWEAYAEYGFELPPIEDYFPNLKNTTATVVNQGNITLKDGATGIYGMAVYGDIRAYNSGTITVGNGVSNFEANFDLRAQGIYLNNFPVNGMADFYAKNEAGGIIVTGDDGAGIRLQNWAGSAHAVNEGSITTGNGGLGDHTHYATGEVYDWLFPSMGMSVVTAGAGFAQTAIAENRGSITTGDLSVGMLVAGGSGGFFPIDPYRLTGVLVNDGTVVTGDNSSGLVAGGNNVVVYNNGSVTTGDLDISAYNSGDPRNASSYNFGRLGYGITARSRLYGFVDNYGSVTTGDNTVGIANGMLNEAFGRATFTTQGEDGIVSTGDNSVGIKNFGTYYTLLNNAGTVSVGNNSVGVELKAGALTHDYYGEAVVISGSVRATNSGLIETGDNSTGVRLIGAQQDATHSWQTYDWSTYPVTIVDHSVTADIMGGALLENTGTIRTGANSTAVEISGYGYYGINLYNVGTIDAGAGTAIKINADNNIGSIILNGGTIAGDILLGAGDDMLLHAQNVDAYGNALSTGNIIMDGNTIDFGDGNNQFVINRGVISVAGGDNLITGTNLDVQMNYAEIDARDDFIIGAATQGISTMAVVPPFSELTINGNVSGNFRFAADVGLNGASDLLTITGDVADGSEIGVVINPIEQLKGEVVFRPIHIDGTNDADVHELAGVTGLYADSFLGGEASFDAASGDVLITATFGMGHMATAASAAAASAQNWLNSSLSNYGNRNIHAYTGRKGDGLSIWGYAFQDEGEIQPNNELQDVSFRQIVSGLQGGVSWSQDIGGGRVTVSPMLTYGNAEASLNANTSSTRGHPWAVGLNANYAMDGGLYADATYQRMRMNVDLKTPQTVTQATGEADINGQGFNLEAGYSHRLKSGLVVQPQLQLTHTKVDLDDFASSDGIYNLSDTSGKATTLRAGLSVYKVFETSNGAITPLASLSYLNAINGEIALDSNGVGFDSDTSGSGYKAEIGVLGRYKAWDFAGKLAFSNTSTTGSILSPSMSARYSFGGAAAEVPSVKTSAVPQLPEVTEATVKFGEAGTAEAAPMATAAPVEDGAPVILRAAYAQPAGDQEKKEEQPVQSAPELDAEQAAEPAADPAAQEPADEAADVVVTGSLIRRSVDSEITPMTVITSEDMAMRGLTNLGDVMASFTENKGYTEGRQSNLLGRFTYGAEEVNFRGLGVGRTLVLVNGRRIADFPLPFGGEQNGVDIAAIPFSAVADVKFLASGASATYGSDAVGGVLNIITKRDMEQTSATLDTGYYQSGYGETVRGSVSTGNSYARGSYTLGLEGYYSGEILASDVPYFKKHAPFDAQMISILQADGSGMQSALPPTACAPLGFEFENDTCVQNEDDTISVSPTAMQLSGFFDGRYDLNDDVELFLTAIASGQKTKSRSNVLFWQGVVFNEDLSSGTGLTRGFSPDELGIQDVKSDQYMWTATTGAKGGFDVGSDKWYWDVAYSYANYQTKQTNTNLKEEGIKNWILAGATSVTDDPDMRYSYIVDDAFYDNQLIDNIVRPVQPSDVDSLIGKNVLKGNSSAWNLQGTVNGELSDFGFLFKPVKFAVRAEYGHQKTEINPDERTLNTTGEGWYGIGTIEAKGTRDHWAVAAELDATVLSNLDVTLAGRYDHYDDASEIGGKFTGQARFLYRPTDWLKVRGGYGQTFRAPDMFNLYGVSDGFQFVPDFAGTTPGGEPCYDGSNYACGFSQVTVTRQADAGLKDEHGHDLGLGVILNPFPNFQMTVDWYDIRLKDLVLTESAFDVLFKEWQCAEGELDPTSQLCADVNDRVVRNGVNQIEQIIVRPINSSELKRTGFDIRASYNYESAKLGSFNLGASYSKVLKFKLTRFAGDDAIDLKYGEPGNSSPANSSSVSLTWYNPLTTGKAVSAGIFVQRMGKVYNYDHTQFMEPIYNVNFVAGYQLNTKTNFRLSIDNVLNTKPQSNGSDIWPYYWPQLESGLGRSAYFTVGYRFN